MNGADTAVTGRVGAWDFRSARGFGNPHLQTLAGGVWPARPRARILRERRELPDGDFVDVDWLSGDDSRPWALILPGIVGNLTSPYAVRLLNRLAAAGYRAGLLNYRGQSGVPNRLATAYHAGFTADLDAVAAGLAGRHGPGIAIGFSMGGSLLLKWLGETSNAAPLRAAAAVSVPFRLVPASRQLGSGRLRAYDRYLTAYLRRFVRRKFAHGSPPFALPPPRALRTLRDFDEHVTAPLHGFADADDYYERASCFGCLRRIAVPTLVVNALDDPMVPRSSLPAARELSPAVRLELSARGGHVGFLGRGRRGLPRFALADRLLGFFAEVCPADSA